MGKTKWVFMQIEVQAEDRNWMMINDKNLIDDHLSQHNSAHFHQANLTHFGQARELAHTVDPKHSDNKVKEMLDGTFTWNDTEIALEADQWNCNNEHPMQ